MGSVQKLSEFDKGNLDTSTVWIIGDKAYASEVHNKSYFSGEFGKLLLDTLNTLDPNFISKCYLTNFEHPTLGNIGSLIEKELEKRKPNLVILLGETVLVEFLIKQNINNYRGSLIEYNNIKFLPINHPSEVYYNPSLYPIFSIDLQRAIEESISPEIPQDDYVVLYNPVSPFSLLDKVEYLSCDIETTRGEDKILLCIGFGFKFEGKDHAMVFEFNGYNDSNIRLLLSGPLKKVFHHGAFDVNVLRMKGYEVNNYTDDTIIMAHILQPELPRSLAFLTSIYTKMPYYKQEGRANLPEDEKAWSVKNKRTKEELWLYNAKDCIATIRIFSELLKELEQDDLMYIYKTEMDYLYCTIDLSQNGVLIDLDRVKLLKTTLESRMLDLMVEFAQLLGKYVNVKSPKAICNLLYKELGLPEKKNKLKTGLTADEDALVSLMGMSKSKIEEFKSADKIKEWTFKYRILEIILKLRGIEKLISSYLSLKLSKDGRARSLYKAHGTESGRLAAAKFVDDTGLNIQTLPREVIEI